MTRHCIDLPAGVFIHELVGAAMLNRQILREFLVLEHDEAITRSHLVNGRFENIYPGIEQVPALAGVLEQACQVAGQGLGLTFPLQAGFWFNAMYPGHVTALHNHDDYDECLSGVYYVTAPEHSGDLILHTADGPFSLAPKAGRCVFFPPAMPHEVSEHHGQSFRLSVGMNFGPLRSAAEEKNCT